MYRPIILQLAQKKQGTKIVMPPSTLLVMFAVLKKKVKSSTRLQKQELLLAALLELQEEDIGHDSDGEDVPSQESLPVFIRLDQVN